MQARFAQYEGPVAACSYMLSSVALIFFNKAAVSVYHFPHLNVITLIQLSFSSLLLFVLKSRSMVRFFKPAIQSPEGIVMSSLSTEIEDEREKLLVSVPTMRKTLWLSMSYMVYLVLGMFALQAVSIPMYTTLRRVSTFFVMLIEYMILGTRNTSSVQAAVGVMVLGALIAGADSFESDYIAYLIVMLYNLATAIYIVLIGKLARQTNLSNWGLSFYNAITCGPVVLLLTIATGELQTCYEERDVWLNNSGFLVSTLGSTVLAFALNFTIFWNTSCNSPLTQSVTGQFKDIATVVVGVALFGDNLVQEPLKLVGVVLGFSASVGYAYAKYTQQQQQHLQQSNAKHKA
eukprot:TRINITY_DN7551_c0_g1_i1.p1 TRINITY_DN7551_c0_g1~~TRINITY_DN7551_c0_g1_i1.p1  ORF type:complete len:347 (-),score=59.67 TRINITY_DN7551_c0_g1_i1:67-1107(-)